MEKGKRGNSQWKEKVSLFRYALVPLLLCDFTQRERDVHKMISRRSGGPVFCVPKSLGPKQNQTAAFHFEHSPA